MRFGQNCQSLGSIWEGHGGLTKLSQQPGAHYLSYTMGSGKPDIVTMAHMKIVHEARSLSSGAWLNQCKAGWIRWPKAPDLRFSRLRLAPPSATLPDYRAVASIWARPFAPVWTGLLRARAHALPIAYMCDFEIAASQESVEVYLRRGLVESRLVKRHCALLAGGANLPCALFQAYVVEQIEQEETSVPSHPLNVWQGRGR